MFFGKPLIQFLNSKTAKKIKKGYEELNSTFNNEEQQNLNNLNILEKDEEGDKPNLTLTSSDIINNYSKEHQHDFGELMVHQSIETVEFILGSVSNTASYLRLWALSLAHSQLAFVFLDLILKPWITGEQSILIGTVGTVVMFVMFFAISFSVIMVMDLMECFLHALRLHWVEFQNKFYKGEGYKFKSFNFKQYVKEQFL